MTFYTVKTQTEYIETYTVDANSKEEAESKIRSDEATMIAQDINKLTILLTTSDEDE